MLESTQESPAPFAVSGTREECPKPVNNLTVTVKGLGDTVATVAATLGLDKLAAAYEQLTGKPCGCKTRQAALNKLLPYGITDEPPSQ